MMKVNMMAALYLAAMLFFTHSVAAAENPVITPRIDLYAEFLTNTRCPVFQFNEPIELWAKVTGWRFEDDKLLWSVSDWEGKIVGSGTLVVQKGREDWTGTVKLGRYGAGYFQINLKLSRANISLPKAGSRPAGFVTYSVLPDIQRLPLAHIDDSHFGAQGQDIIESGVGEKKDANVYSIYSLGGMKWTYRNRRLYEIGGDGPDSFKPVLDAEKAKTLAPYEAGAGMCLFVDSHSLPPWLTKLPEGINAKSLGRSPAHDWSSYAPNDYEKFEDLIGKVAAEQAVLKKTSFPNQAKNYYQIHWECDWHWKGTDEEFIQMYAHAHKAIHRNDPDGLLLGVNFGQIEPGNKNLERLFAKGLGNHLDGMVTHTYYLPMSQRSPEQAGLNIQMRKLAEMTKKYLPPNAPIIQSEWGVNSTLHFGKSPLEDLSVLPKELAWFMRGHIINLGEGARTTFFFYTVDHDEYGLMFNLTYPYPGFGTSHVSPKPVFSAVAAATRLLDGTTNVGGIDYLGKNVMGYLFDRGGTLLAAIWSPDEQTRTLSFPCAAEQVTLYDAMGNRKEIKAAHGNCEIVVGPAPVYLAGLSPTVVPSANILFAPTTAMSGSTVDISKTDQPLNFTLHTGSANIPCGDSKALTIPNTVQPGTWLLSSSDKNGKTTASQRLTITAPVELSVEKSSVNASEQNAPLLAHLKNLTAATVTGRLKLLTEANVLVEDIAVTLPPNGKIDQRCALANLPTSATARPIIHVRFTDSHDIPIETSIELEQRYIVARLSKAPTIDGDLSEWNLESFQTVDTADAVKIRPADWGGPADLSFRFSFKYDDHALYVALKVRDQTFYQQRSAADAWAEDSVQLGIALGRTQAGWKMFHKLCFAVDSATGQKLTYRHNGTKDLPPCELDGGNIKFAFKRIGDESHYEMAIPWTELDRQLKHAPTEKMLGLGIFVNDVDRQPQGPTPRKAMEAFGGMMDTKPELFGNAILE